MNFTNFTSNFRSKFLTVFKFSATEAEGSPSQKEALAKAKVLAEINMEQFPTKLADLMTALNNFDGKAENGQIGAFAVFEEEIKKTLDSIGQVKGEKKFVVDQQQKDGGNFKTVDLSKKVGEIQKKIAGTLKAVTKKINKQVVCVKKDDEQDDALKARANTIKTDREAMLKKIEEQQKRLPNKNWIFYLLGFLVILFMTFGALKLTKKKQ